VFTHHVFDRLAAYAEHQLDAASLTHVEAHLSRCARCRAALDEVRRGIALASELEPVAMPAAVAGRIRNQILAAGAPSTAGFRWAYAAAGILLAIAATAVYWQVNRPWARLIEAQAAPTRFERDGRDLHERLKSGEVTLAYTTSDELDAWRWLRSQRAPVTSLRPNRTADDRLRFVPLGATVREIAGIRTSVISYRIDGRPVTLMLAFEDEVPDAPSPGWWSKRVTHRHDARGANTLTWTVGGGTYVLVSELEGHGQRACFICHTDEKFQRPILSLGSGSD
jgi:anti-sigma factor RsiW